jgi:hypothetical protein
MSEAHDTPSAAERMYPGGPISDAPGQGRAAEMIEAGIARPSNGVALFGDDRPSPAGDQSRPSPTPSPGQARPGLPFDAARWSSSSQAYDVDADLMTEFGALAKDAGVGQYAGDKLLALHQRALAAQNAKFEQETANWYAMSQREFGADLPMVVNEIKGAVDKAATPVDAKRFYQLLEWSGLAAEPAVLRTLHRLAARY